MDLSLRRCARLIAFAVTASVLGACGHTQVIYREGAGGQLAFKGRRAPGLKRAQQEMAAHCGPSNYRITREERVVLGTNKSTVAQMGAGPGGFGGQYVSSEQVQTETRLTYKCGDSALALGANTP